MMEPKLPDVFQLNLWPPTTGEDKVLNNGSNPCRCQVDNECDGRQCSAWVMRIKKIKVIVFAIALICFFLGLAIPFLVLRSSESKRSSSYSSDIGIRPIPNSGYWLRNSNNSLSHVFISVKTTRKYHYPRVIIQLETWVNLVKEQVWFFTDSHDSELDERTNGHWIVTNCSASHSRVALACKMGAEFDTFLQSHKPWWCHFDDDNYVHIVALTHLLQSHSSEQPVYIGKPSTAHPIEIWDVRAPQNVSRFWFATGGAGFCVSRTLALKMAPYAANGNLVHTGEEFWFPDDVTLGYIIEHLLKEKLTVAPQFHSHLEPMKSVSDLEQQISVSYSDGNAIDLDGPFSLEVDPTRFYSLHCRLYGGTFCPL